MKKIALVSCVKKKLTQPAPAKDLYTSTLFKFTYAYAQTFKPEEIYVLSAKYGLVPADKRIEPYELTLNTMGAGEIRSWAENVLGQLRKVADLERDHFIILAGEKYGRYVVPELVSYEVPLEGLPFGKQLGHLKRLLEAAPSKRLPKHRPSNKPHDRPTADTDGHHVCEELHRMTWQLPRHTFPFDTTYIPANGIYILFEQGEPGHGGDRIVRVGSHTGGAQLRARLKQHFLTPNKDRSIFRKNIGRAILNRDCDPFLASWEKDLTTRLARERHGDSVDLNYQIRIEAAVSDYIRESFSFVVFEVLNKNERLGLEAKLISTVSRCNRCRPSAGWLGLNSPKEKIRQSGLWLVNHLYRTPATVSDLSPIGRAQAGSRVGGTAS